MSIMCVLEFSWPLKERNTRNSFSSASFCHSTRLMHTMAFLLAASATALVLGPAPGAAIVLGAAPLRVPAGRTVQMGLLGRVKKIFGMRSTKSGAPGLPDTGPTSEMIRISLLVIAIHTLVFLLMCYFGPTFLWAILAGFTLQPFHGKRLWEMIIFIIFQ